MLTTRSGVSWKPGNDEKIREFYPNYEYNSFVQSVSILLDLILEEPLSALNTDSIAPTSQSVPTSTPTVIPSSPVKEPQEEIPKEALKVESKPNGIQDSASFVLDILRAYKQELGIPKDTIQNVLRGLGYAMLDVDSILAKLKSAGEIIEPKNSFFRAV